MTPAAAAGGGGGGERSRAMATKMKMEEPARMEGIDIPKEKERRGG